MNRNFLNAADHAIESLINPESFDESLALNVLFQDGLILHEAYFFNSQLLKLHLAKHGENKSLFELAAERGLILPAFRDRKVQSLYDARESMNKPSVYGDGGKGFMAKASEKNKPLLSRIVASVDAGLSLSTTRPLYWPDRVGDGYELLIGRMLQSEQPPNIEGASEDHKNFLDRVWEPTRLWRFDCIHEASIATKKKSGEGGIQRLEIYKALARNLGFDYDDNSDARLQFHRYCKDDEEKIRVDAFLKWLAQCHHINFARSLGVSINFPVYDLDRDFVLDSLVRTSVDSPIAPTSSGFRTTVDFPPMEVLLQSSPRELVAIRKDVGEGYIKALQQWQSEPSDSRRLAVEKLLKSYCTAICDALKTRNSTMEVEYLPGSLKQIAAGVGHLAKGIQVAGGFATAGLLSGGLIQAAGSYTGAFIGAGSLATAAYLFVRNEYKKNSHKSVKRELEISLGTTV